MKIGGHGEQAEDILRGRQCDPSTDIRALGRGKACYLPMLYAVRIRFAVDRLLQRKQGLFQRNGIQENGLSTR